MAEYCLLTLPLCLIIIGGFRARRKSSLIEVDRLIQVLNLLRI